MHAGYPLLALMMVLCACAHAGAEAPIHSEKLLAEVPQGWVKAVDRQAGALHLAEYYPAEIFEQASPDDWSEKLTVEALSGADLPDPLIFVEGLAEEQQQACRQFVDNAIFAGFENGYPTTVHMMQCGRNKRSGNDLLTMLKVIKGNEALYTVTRIWRFQSAAATSEFDPDAAPVIPIETAAVGGWSQVLGKIRVCDHALDAHPCPPE